VNVYECRGGKRSKVSPRGALNLPAARFLQTKRFDPLLRSFLFFFGKKQVGGEVGVLRLESRRGKKQVGGEVEVLKTRVPARTSAALRPAWGRGELGGGEQRGWGILKTPNALAPAFKQHVISCARPLGATLLPLFLDFFFEKKTQKKYEGCVFLFR
jgi:hypothetical protein